MRHRVNPLLVDIFWVRIGTRTLKAVYPDECMVSNAQGSNVGKQGANAGKEVLDSALMRKERFAKSCAEPTSQRHGLSKSARLLLKLAGESWSYQCSSVSPKPVN